MRAYSSRPPTLFRSSSSNSFAYTYSAIRLISAAVMGHIDICLEGLCRLIKTGDRNSLQMAENAIEEYWAATPANARKSGLLYIQQILQDQRDALGPQSRDFAALLDTYFEKKLSS